MSQPQNPALEGLRLKVAVALDDLSCLFKPGVRTAFIAFFPDHPDRDIVVTDASYPELYAAIDRLKAVTK